MKYWQCKCLTCHVARCSFRCFWFCLQLRPVLLLQHSLQSPLAEKPPPTERPSGAGAVGSSRTMRPPSLGKTLSSPPPLSGHPEGSRWMDRWTGRRTDRKSPPTCLCKWPLSCWRCPQAWLPSAPRFMLPQLCPGGFSCASAVPSPPRGSGMGPCHSLKTSRVAPQLSVAALLLWFWWWGAFRADSGER